MTAVDLPSCLPTAIRAWTSRPEVKSRKRRRRGRWPATPEVRHVLVVDTETTVDSAQGLLFGAFRYCRIDGTAVTCVAEGLIHADDLPLTDPEGMRRLQNYAGSRKADVDMTYLAVEPNWDLQLMSRTEFVDRWLYRVGYRNGNMRDPAMIVMFNAPFDLSRLAVRAAEARADMYGGFSFVVWVDDHGEDQAWRPRIVVKAIDSKRSLKKFTRLERDAKDFTGHLLDLRTLVFALTGESHSLDSAARAFGVPGKGSAELGVITEASIDYCLRDVAVTTDVLDQALVEFAKHPIELQATKAYSPASVAKAYLRAMGIEPRLRRQPDMDPALLGLAMEAFYGGRAEVHLRHQPLPVRLVDFTSMYPTVDQLLGLWELVVADRIETVVVTDEINRMLEAITLDGCFDPQRWAGWVVVAQVVPDGDVLPVRAAYGPLAMETDANGRPPVNGWSIGVNPLFVATPLAYPLCDLIAAKLTTGRAPRVVKAVRFAAAGGGRQQGLRPVRLRGAIDVDPLRVDFFRRVIEARQEIRATVKGDEQRCSCSDCRTQAFLKVLANAGSYGIFAEMIRREVARGSKEKVTVHTGTGSFTAGVGAPEQPGEFCFPPIAACITGAARLMLTLLERSVEDAGGSWMFCDTDSMAIVATEAGDLFACPGGPHRLPDGTEAVRALSHADVDTIRERFLQLNPYDRTKVPDLLKVEQDGICLAISAKRYAIWDTDDPAAVGGLTPVKISQHGLGRYLDPVQPGRDRRNDKGQLTWILEAWQWVALAMGDPHAPMPDWANQPAVSRISVSSTTLWSPFRRWNRRRSWAGQIKPFNFLLVADVDPFGYPPGVDPQRFRLIAPYSSDPDDWQHLEWRNLYDPDGPTYRITTDRQAPPEPDLVIVKDYATVLRNYRLHPEHKFHGPDGRPCRRSTRGVLRRRPVAVLETRHIGKEANNLDDVRAGLHGDLSDVVNEYPDPGHDPLHALVLPVLAGYSGRRLADLLETDRRTIDRIRAGGTPRRALRARIIDLARRTRTGSSRGTGS